ncbi:histone acetyltransferase [Ranunculus cassubicifolius]
MHLQTHMSGQIPGQIPNQAGPQLSGLPLQNGSSIPSSIQSLGGLRNTSSMDPDLEMRRKFIRERIYQKLIQQRAPMTVEMQPKMKDIVTRLEVALYKSAASKEEYLNMDTLDTRLYTLIKRLPASGHSQQLNHNALPHNASSSSISTMIPTPGISHSGNMNLTVTSSLDSSMNPTSGYSALVPNNVNMGSLHQNANGSSSGIYGGSFNASDGAMSNGYQQAPSHVIGSGANNMSSVYGQRIATQMIPTPGQMIPTPGLSNFQSSVNSEPSYSGGGFSGVEPTMVSQSQLHPKRQIDGQNNRVVPSFGGQVGGMRSTLQQNLPSYGFSNGDLNGGSGLIGNEMQLNGTSVSDNYLTTSQFGDDYAMNLVDLSGPGNLYGTGSGMSSMMNNQNLSRASMESRPKSNSSLTSSQPMQAAKQTAHMKPQVLEPSSKMNFQGPNISQNELQKYQQNDHQTQQQFVQQQLKKKQITPQQQQLMMRLKSDAIRQSRQTSSLGSQVIPEHHMESHNLLSQGSEQFQLSDLQNQFQQISDAGEQSRSGHLLCQPSGSQGFDSSLAQNSEHMQQMLHPHQQIPESQNKFNGLSANSEPESLLQGSWHSDSKENLLTREQRMHESHTQEEFCQRLTVLGDAQQPLVLSEGSVSAHNMAARNVTVPSNTNGAGVREVMNSEHQYLNQQRWLLFLVHARGCSAAEGKCQEANCISVQKLWKHMRICKIKQCSYPRCGGTKGLIDHHRNCCWTQCPVCVPVRRFVDKHKGRIRPSSNSGQPNSSSVSWKPIDARGPSRLTLDTDQSLVRTSEDLQSPLKRMKTEHLSTFVAKSENSLVTLPGVNLSHVSQDAPNHVSLATEVPISVKHEVVEMKSEQHQSFGTRNPNSSESKKDVPVDGYNSRLDVELIYSNKVSGLIKQEAVVADKETDRMKQEIKQETSNPASEHAIGTKSGKPKIKAVSLTELFTPEQIREHIIGLRKWIGQSKAKAEKNQAMERSMSENSCQLCAVEKLAFEPPPMYCTPCGARIKRNAMFYTTGTGDTRHYFCIPCYNEARGDTVEIDGTAVPKAKMEKKRNDEETEEWWVQCDKCEAWQHQICALFNGRRNDGGQAEYTCPNCCVDEIERGERKPLPQSSVLGAKDLPKTILSEHIENRLSRRLKQEKLERAKLSGKAPEEIPGAEALVVRVVSSVDKKLEVKQNFLEIFQEDNYPKEFPYKSKVILLFQNIEGVEVCLFGMYVQEFGSECQYPNQRRVYLSYLDSVKYFRPEIRTVTGEALRTFVYHEILIGYLEYCKARGFTSCYIWACPPLKGEDYILYCHPEIQKTPKSDKLREWYLSMLRKAIKENIVVGLTNLYDHFFVSNGECKAKVTAARLPYFDGDYWPGAAEDMISQFLQDDDGRKLHKKGKTKKTITKRALKAAGHTDLSENATKDILLMQKLGETISPMKEDFIMVHLQHACNHCCHLMVSGNRWVCNKCRNFQLCDRCHDAEERIEERERHPIHSREKHSFYPVEVRDVAVDTKDRDEILESEFFDTRQAFLSLCQGNHYQYDTLRRAKHSSMMVLYHLHNPTAPAFVTTCNVCHNDVETGAGWRCETCADYDVCNACYQKEGGIDHPHNLTNHPSNADRDAQNKEGRQKRVAQLRKMLDLLVHASQCRYPNCPYPNCRRVKGLFRHGMQCRTRASGGCVLCKKMWYILQLHARACKESECHVPRCKDLKEHVRRLQQQSDSRRRAAVMEMMRQRAAEVAGGSSG